MPWLSSSACTTLASMFEAVRKMTVRSATRYTATTCAPRASIFIMIIVISSC
jgi:hypothetical protein